MFGFVTKAKHEAALAYERQLADRWYRSAMKHAADAEELRAEIDHLRPLAQKHLNSLAALKQNKGKGK